MKLTVQEKLRYIQEIAKTFWDVQEPQTAQSSNRGQPLHETLFSASGVMSTYWVKGWLYDEEIEMNESGIIKTLTAGMQVRRFAATRSAERHCKSSSPAFSIAGAQDWCGGVVLQGHSMVHPAKVNRLID